MNTIEVSNVQILDINSDNVKKQNSVICLEQNGFLLCKQGSISLIMDDHLYKVQPGDLYIYPAFSQTYIHSVTDDLKGVVGRADFDFVLSSLDSIASTYEISLESQIVAALVQAFCYEVVDAYITNSKEQVQSKKQTRRDKIFQNFLVALHRNFREHRDVGFYAEQQHLTPRYFSTLVHEVSGKTPLQWITLFVITEAKQLLSNPEISIKEVADRLNFTEQSFFGRYFKQYTGCSPSEYRSRSTE